MTHPDTAQLADWDRQYVWHPFTPMKPWIEDKQIVVIDRGEAEFLIDTEGRRYIDGVSSLWCNIHGHAVPELDAAVREQLGKIAHTTLLGLASPPSILLARRLVELVRARGMNLARVFYSDNGSTAVEVACKTAYQYHRNAGRPRTRFVALSDAYHGDTLGAVSLGGIPIFHAAFKNLCFQVDFLTPPRRAEDLPAFRKQLADLLAGGQHAAVVMEPLIQGAGGMIFHPPGTLAAVRELTAATGTLLIADEVMTGFGRTGRWFACEHEQVTPDLLCLSKGLTGGYMPLGVTMCTQGIFDAFYADPREGKTLFHGHTFTGHPLACAVALRSIDLMDERGLLGRIPRLGRIIDEALAPLDGHRHVRNLRRLGLVAALDITAEDGTAYPYHYRIGGALCTAMRSRGVMLRPLADTLILMPPLAIREENLHALCAAVVESVSWVDRIVADKEQQFGEQDHA